MSACVIIDAGPSLTFYAAGKQGLLHAAMAAISHELVVPEIIQTEVLSKADRDPCFSSVRARFERDIAAERLEVISDDRGAALAAVIVEVQRFIRGLKKDGNGDPVSLDAPLSAEDRGEATVIAHAELYRQQGRSVRILIDEWRGQKAAQARGFSVIDSTTILLKAAKLGLIADRGQMRSIWTRFQELDFSHTHWSLNPRLHVRSIYRTEVPADEAPWPGIGEVAAGGTINKVGRRREVVGECAGRGGDRPGRRSWMPTVGGLCKDERMSFSAPQFTSRLRLSPLEAFDTADIFRIYGDPATWTHLPEGRFTRPEQAAGQVENSLASYRDRGLGMWGIRIAAGGATPSLPEGTFIGSGGVQFVAAATIWNLGYRLAPESWGRGFATEVAVAALRAATEVAPHIPITARVLSNNPASAAILEKLGLTLIWEGHPQSVALHEDPDAPLRRIYADRELEPGALSWLLAHA